MKWPARSWSPNPLSAQSERAIGGRSSRRSPPCTGLRAGELREWRDRLRGRDGKRRRDLYLDLQQRRALLGVAAGAIRTLIEGVVLTGARAGELVNATVSQFDPRTASMTFRGKTGERTVPLSPAAAVLFKRLAGARGSQARLFVRDDGRPRAQCRHLPVYAAA